PGPVLVVGLQHQMLSGVPSRDRERTGAADLAARTAENAVAVECKFGRKAGFGGIRFNDNRVSGCQYLPIRIAGSKGSGDGVRIKNCPVMETDTVAQKKAPALVSRLHLPGNRKTRLWTSALIERDQCFENEPRKTRRARGGESCGIESRWSFFHGKAQGPAIVRPGSGQGHSRPQ